MCAKHKTNDLLISMLLSPNKKTLGIFPHYLPSPFQKSTLKIKTTRINYKKKTIRNLWFIFCRAIFEQGLILSFGFLQIYFYKRFTFQHVRTRLVLLYRFADGVQRHAPFEKKSLNNYYKSEKMLYNGKATVIKNIF